MTCAQKIVVDIAIQNWVYKYTSSSKYEDLFSGYDDSEIVPSFTRSLLIDKTEMYYQAAVATL